MAARLTVHLSREQDQHKSYCFASKQRCIQCSEASRVFSIPLFLLGEISDLCMHNESEQKFRAGPGAWAGKRESFQSEALLLGLGLGWSVSALPVPKLWQKVNGLLKLQVLVFGSGIVSDWGRGGGRGE